MLVESILSKCNELWVEHGLNLCCGCKKTIGRGGAKFSLLDAPAPHFILDADRIRCLSAGRHCDYIFVAGDENSDVLWISPIEITSSARKKPRVILEQIQRVINTIEEQIDASRDLKMRPILVGRYNRRRMSKGSGNFKVKFRGKVISVAVIENGGSIAKALHD